MLLLSVILEFNLYGQIEKMEDRVWERNNELIRKNDELISNSKELIKRNNQLIECCEENRKLRKSLDYAEALIRTNSKLNHIYGSGFVFESQAYLIDEIEDQLKEKEK